MKATVDALVQVTLYSAAITAGILLFRFIFKKRISSKLQYLMWWLLILRLIIPVTPDIGLHLGLQDIPLKQSVQAVPSNALPLNAAPSDAAPVLNSPPTSAPIVQPSYESEIPAPAVQPNTDVAPSQHVNPAKSTDWYSIVFVWRYRLPRLADIRKAALLRIPPAPHGGWTQGGLRALRQVLQGARCKAASPLDSE